MQPETMWWIVIFLASFTIMFIIVPPRKGPDLAPFGFWLGIVQAMAILWFGQTFFKVFLVKGDPTILGIPVSITLMWFPIAVIFAYFFPRMDTLLKKVVYIMVFAVGSSLGQFTLENLGLWESLRWNPLYTFLLAIVTHSILSGVLLVIARSPRFSGVLR